ncbi:voltage-dependent calcium channel subunit alpha-2/delta-2-like isoform X3 [Asterias rubens]|uniref:voltage-dependent calcium channel subunit alpha-2/delta-2-like isoform X3 n=1 Tax=Asterias rubens TaxID=7604 RepID=UPI00145590C6|nr:voltage-dependent calcium channel subunit alpha-2/delta-2-like isoform X3 [Asterias rubens]
MAGTRTFFGVISVLYLLSVFEFCRVKANGVQMPAPSLVSNWSAEISKEITRKLDEASGVEEVQKLYKDEGFKTVFVNGSELVLTVANKWQEMLQDKMVAVNAIVKALEESYKNHNYSNELTESNVTYFNAKTMSNSSIDLTYNDMFKSYVNTTYSSVQIPTDIWVGDKTILNGIQATNSIDKVFRSNYEKDPQLLWQYFGSADGFYRSYPAAEWKTSDPDRDQYDVRRRGWYIQAASSPKNVMILVDTSGSTYGMTLEITKVSVSKALDTLGNDDFVNVAYFNSSAYFVSCFETFKQANLRNKNLLKAKVKELQAFGVADFKVGLEKAFQAFQNFSKIEEGGRENQNQGASCHQVILIFTDGGEMNEEETFKKWNDPVKTRVFVFKVGTDSLVPQHGVRQMACSNKGYYSNIQSFGAVRLTTLNYVPVLSRPMVLSGKKHFQWSDIYLDVLGLGMMTTLTQPVYNKSGENNQQMVAVVGTDITTKNMEDTVPQRKPGYNSVYNKSIGPEGYAFGINSNGYILLHPRLKAEEEIKAILELGYLTEPPNVDFLEVEYNSPKEKKQLRIDMIDQRTGQVEMFTPIMSRDERYLEFVNMTYSYTFIENTTFSVAIAQPRFGLIEWELAPKITSLQGSLDAIITAQDGVFLLIAPWEFCASHDGQEGNTSTDNIVETLQQAINNIGGTDVKLETCNDEMVRNLLVDADITKTVGEYWKETQTSNPAAFEGILYNIVAANGGVTRIYPSSVAEKWSKDELRAIQDPWDQAYFQRALYNKNYVFSVPYNKGMMPLPVNETFLTPIRVSKAANVEVNAGHAISHAVVAVYLDSSVFNDIWIKLTKKGFNNKESDAISCTNESIHCTVLDDGGFIIATNQEDQQGTVGSFFGLHDGDLMAVLKNETVYKLMQMNDFQAACARQQDDTSASAPRSVKIPTISDVINFNSWAATAAWSFLRHFLYDMLFLGVTDYSNHFAEADEIQQSENVSCIKILQQFYYGEVKNAFGEISCGYCNRLWRSSRIEGTNLLLVVTERNCDNCTNQVVKQAPLEPDLSKGEGPDPCTAEPQYRKRPTEHCYDFDPNESVLKCSSASVLRCYLPLLLGLHLVFVIFTRMISD